MIVEPRDSYLGYPGDSYLGGEDYSLTGLSFTVPDYLNGTTLDLYYELIDDRGGSLEASQSLNIVAPQPKVYSTIESEGNITLVKDQDNLAHIYKILKITINLLSTSINILQLTPLDRTGKFLAQKILTVLTLLSGNLLTRSMLTTLVLLVPQSLSG